MRPCISETTTLPNSFADDITAYADAGCSAMEVWLTKLEGHLEKASISDTRKLLDDRDMTLAAAAYQGGLLLSQGEQRKAHFDHYRRRLELCRQLGIPTLVLAGDFAGGLETEDLERAVVSLVQAAQLAAPLGVRLALEFQSSASFCTNVETALGFIGQCGQPNLGLCLDAFHFYTGPSKLEDLALLSPRTLFHVQLCDLAGVPRELATDKDRILPGDGDFQLVPVLGALRGIGYDGWVSLELMNPTLWKTKASQVAELGIAALRRLMTNAQCLMPNDERMTNDPMPND
jgi:sugar phosphate isomerase/epimerase